MTEQEIKELKKLSEAIQETIMVSVALLGLFLGVCFSFWTGKVVFLFIGAVFAGICIFVSDAPYKIIFGNDKKELAGEKSIN